MAILLNLAKHSQTEIMCLHNLQPGSLMFPLSLTDQRHSLHHHQPVKSRLHSRNSFISTSQPLLCKPTEAPVAKWQEQWEATQSNLKTYDVHPKEQLPSGHTLTWHTWRMANRVRSGQAATRQRSICGATGRAKTVCVARPHVISATL